MTKFRKTITAGLVAATLGVGVAGTSTPAAAWGYYPYWGWGAGAAVAGLALGAAAAAAATPYYVYPSCYLTRQPVVDHWGNIIRYRRVRVCN
jgi:hypothetical protein